MGVSEADLERQENIKEAKENAEAVKELARNGVVIDNRRGSESYASDRQAKELQEFINSVEQDSYTFVDNDIENLMQMVGAEFKTEGDDDAAVMTWKGQVVNIRDRDGAANLTNQMLDEVYGNLSKNKRAFQVLLQDKSLTNGLELDRDKVLARVAQLLKGEYDKNDPKLKEQFDLLFNSGGNWDRWFGNGYSSIGKGIE